MDSSTVASPDSVRISARISTIWRGSSPTVGSSRMRTCGLVDDGLGDADALAVALRELADVAAGHRA